MNVGQTVVDLLQTLGSQNLVQYHGAHHLFHQSGVGSTLETGFELLVPWQGFLLEGSVVLRLAMML